MSNEYLTGNEQIAYPFTEGAAGLAPATDSGSVGATPYLPLDFLLDAVITARPSSDAVYLRSIENVGGDYIFTFRDATYEVLVHTLTAVPSARSVLELTDDDPPDEGLGEDVFIQVVTGPSFAAYLALLAPGAEVDFGTRLRFETSVVELRPDRLRSFASSNGAAWIYMTDEIEFVEGYNCDLSADGEGLAATGRDGTPVTITLSPGLGAGLYPCAGSSSTDYLATISGVQPDENGNVNLATDGCHVVTPLPGSNEILLHNMCVAACTCDQYAAVVAALGSLFELAKTAKDTMDRASSSLTADILAWNIMGGSLTNETVIMTMEGAVGTDGAGVPNNYCMVNMKLATNKTALPSDMKAQLVPHGMTGMVPIGGMMHGTNSDGLMITAVLTSTDVDTLTNGSGWYNVLPNLLFGPSLELKVMLSVPAGSSAHCASADGSYNGTGLSAAAKGAW